LTKTSLLLEYAPRFSPDGAASLAEEFYGIRATASQLPSERDQNFLLVAETGERFVLKIANGLEDRSLILAQNAVMNYLSTKLSTCQKVVLSRHGKETEEAASGEQKHFVRLVSYLPGAPLGNTPKQSPALLRDVGFRLGELDRALLQFDHPAIHRNFHWDVAHWKFVLTTYLRFVMDETLSKLISGYAREFESEIAPRLDNVRQSAIHADANDYNVLVDAEAERVSGIIDFGDMVYSYTVGDLAVALAYVVLGKKDPLGAATEVVRGYHEALQLQPNEAEIVWPLMLMRLCMSVCVAGYQQQKQPGNEYLMISQQSIRESLPQLLSIDGQQTREALVGAIKSSADYAD